MQGNGLKGQHVLIAMLAFFGVIFAVNGVFLYLALGTYTGVVQVEPYRKGLAYNERIAAEAKQVSLGWDHQITVRRDGEVRVVLEDANGAPVTGLKIELAIGRPSTAARDERITLVEGEAGTYRGRVSELEDGRWLASFEATRSEPTRASEPVYRVKERIWLKP